MVTNRVLGTVLLGVNEQVNCSDCVSAFGSAGSFSAGIHGRKEITNNLSLLAGLAYTQYSEGGYNVTSAPIGAFALRYDFTDWGSSRPFFDVGTARVPPMPGADATWIALIGEDRGKGNPPAAAAMINFPNLGPLAGGCEARRGPPDKVGNAKAAWQATTVPDSR